MIAQRLRGLVNLHVIAATLVASFAFLAYASIYNYLPWVEGLSQDLALAGYVLCIAAATATATRQLQSMAPRFHMLNWMDAGSLASRQTAYIALLVFAFMFAFKDRAMSRLFVGTYLVLVWVILVLFNMGLPKLLSQIFFEKGRRMPTLFIGSESTLQRLKGWLASKEMLGLHPVGFLSDSMGAGSVSAPPFLGPVAKLPQMIEQHHVAQVMLLEIPRDPDEGVALLETCQRLGCRLLIYSNLAELFRHPLVTVAEQGHQFYSLQEEPLEDPINRLAKRLFDLGVSLPVVVFVLPPLCAWVWWMQRRQAPGPLFFPQERTGHGQRSFWMLKFRSMYAENRSREEEAVQARAGDGRVFPFGQFMRRTSLDEFPQFWNVLTGHMSVVGPRPHMTVHDSRFAEELNIYRTRFFVKPGITGLAQVNGFRGEITQPDLLRRRVEFDLTYVSQWSVWMDVWITLKTARQVFFPPKTAY